DRTSPHAMSTANGTQIGSKWRIRNIRSLVSKGTAWNSNRLDGRLPRSWHTGCREVVASETWSGASQSYCTDPPAPPRSRASWEESGRAWHDQPQFEPAMRQ